MYKVEDVKKIVYMFLKKDNLAMRGLIEQWQNNLRNVRWDYSTIPNFPHISVNIFYIKSRNKHIKQL